MTARAAQQARVLGGVAGFRDLTGASSPRSLEWSAVSGQLQRVLPRTYMCPEALDDWVSRCRAALEYAGDDSAVSHLSALRLWDLPSPAHEDVQVLVPHDRRPRAGSPPTTAGVSTVTTAAHIRAALATRAEPVTTVAAGTSAASASPFLLDVRRSRHRSATRVRDGVRVVTLERAVVEAWPLLSDAAQRAPALAAVRRRMTTPQRLRHQLRAHPRLGGRRELHELLDLLEAGCHSELEIWGYRRVFTGGEFAHMKRQVRRVVAGRVVYLDVYDPQTLLALELDGREYHDDPCQREKDIARDAALAEEGVLTLRFSHRRLTDDPLGCRRQATRVRAIRRRQLSGVMAIGDAQLPASA
jgi:very-short-patch-repair endonuclease